MIQTVVKQNEKNNAIQCCVDCKNCIEAINLTLRCTCVFKIDVVTGNRDYLPCERARFLINGDGNLGCDFFKRRTTFFERIKSLFALNR